MSKSKSNRIRIGEVLLCHSMDVLETLVKDNERLEAANQSLQDRHDQNQADTHAAAMSNIQRTAAQRLSEKEIAQKNAKDLAAKVKQLETDLSRRGEEIASLNTKINRLKRDLRESEEASKEMIEDAKESINQRG